ncbi:MAG: hypothetical protein R8G60_11740 [Roseovarius pacificus]|nr:hypothetical protein [Roseovarius pacificus]
MADIEELIEETRASLERVQTFDAQQLVQREKLGQLSFEGAVKPAKRLVGLFLQLPTSITEALPANELNVVKQHSNATYQLFQDVLDFDMEQAEPRQRHDAAVKKIVDKHQQLFTALFPLISYSMARTVDFNQLEAQGRAAVQSVRDQADQLMQEIEGQKTEAADILDDVRAAAAEQGVSQQAQYFKDEADQHQTDAKKWRDYTIGMAVAVGVYGIVTLFLHKWTLLTPSNLYETIQFTAGKLVVFFVLTYMLVLCAKNFTSNRHNEIVNRHRQNALMTYKALVDAGGTPEARDVVLNHAASSIYRLHETGYTRGSEGGGSSSSSVIEMLPRTSLPLSGGGSGL